MQYKLRENVSANISVMSLAMQTSTYVTRHLETSIGEIMLTLTEECLTSAF
jgi:hypothetical protein